VPDILKPHQREALPGYLEALRRFGCVVDFSSMGVGKTYLACAALRALELPTLVVAPRVALTGWRRVAAVFDDKHSVMNYEMLRTGRTPYGYWDHTPEPGWEREEFYTCQCCQQEFDFENFTPCYCHPTGCHCMIIKKRKWNYGQFHFHPAVKAVVFDEVHRCSGVNSLNSKMLIAAKREGKKILALSATAGLSPLDMQALGYATGLHELHNFYPWARRHGCKNDPSFGGFVWLQTPERQAEIMKKIGEALIPSHGVRLRAEDIPGFPECDISAALYDLEKPELVDALYGQMGDALAALDARSADDISSDHPLTKLLRARQKLEILKVPIAVELAQDLIAKGHSVVIGVNFQQTLDELKKRLGWKCFIDGTPAGVRDRQKHIDSFQADEERGMVVNVKAGGICVSLQDLRGQFSRVGLAMPGDSAIDMIQFFGRLPREGAKSKSHYRVLLAANTVEEQIQKRFNAKRGNITALNDRDLTPDLIPVKII
jgi:superfamily II DNA or RNA helicase